MKLGWIVGVLLFAASARAGPITSSAFTSAAVPGWVAPFVPLDAVSLGSPFTFENGSGDWAYLYEETGCGENQIGWADRQTPSVGVIFDFAAQPGAMTTLTLPMTIGFTNRVGGNVWTSSDAGSPFTLFTDSTGAYYLAMESSCSDEASGSRDEPSEVSGAGNETRSAPSTPPLVWVAYNRALIRITMKPQALLSNTTPPTGDQTTTVPPVIDTPTLPPGLFEATSEPHTTLTPVPEPATLTLVALGVAATSVRRIRAAARRHH